MAYRSEVHPTVQPGEVLDPLDQDRAASMADEGGAAAVAWEAPCADDARGLLGLALIGLGVGASVVLWLGQRARSA
jgi:hypothetical protein